MITTCKFLCCTCSDDEKERDLPRMDRNEHSQGTKLKVRYGRGKNQKIYEAKACGIFTSYSYYRLSLKANMALRAVNRI